jgi:DNA-directed RNA polymerase subunit RPC12/RpoP
MIFDAIHSGDMFHMMDWGSGFWYFLIIVGIIVFFVITFVLLYVMRKGTRKLEQEISSEKKTKTRESRSNQHPVETKFCPECGIKLEGEDVAYCPACGYKILKTNEKDQ